MRVVERTEEKSTGRKNLLGEYSISLVLVLFCVVMQLLQPKFLSPANIGNILLSASAAGIVAIGAMLVLISGGMDFTAGYGVALCGVVGGTVYEKTGSPVLLILSCILCGACIGFVNGFLITRLGIQSFIVTLAMMTVVQGLIYIVCEGKIIFLQDPVSSFIGKQTFFGCIPFQAVLWAGLTLLTHYILRCTRLGTYTYAIGGNEEAARCAGIPISRCKVYIFTLAGACTGIASLLMVTQLGVITPSIGSTTLMDAISAAVIGGTSNSGGKGNAVGTLIGALIIGMISNALVLLLVPTNAQYLIKGLIIIGALYFNKIVDRNAG